MKVFLLTLLCLPFFLPAAFSQDDGAWLSGGPYYGGFLGKGVKGDYFDPGLGVKASFGARTQGRTDVAYYSFSFFRLQNRVGESTLPVNVFHHSFELYSRLGKKRIAPYASYGLGMGVLKVSGLKGVDRYFYLPLGLGLRWDGNKVLADLYGRFFGAFGNQFGQRIGYETGLMFGFIF
jgi:hypothetical protein